MDIPRQSAGRKRRLRQVIYSLAALSVATALALGVTRLKPASPVVERSGLWIDTVKRGPMVRQVRGPGTLVPEEVRVIAAPIEGRIERILVQPGSQVTAGTLLMELSNPALEQAAQDAEYQLQAAQSDLKNIRVKLESEQMSQRASAAAVGAEYQQAKLQLDTDEELAQAGLIPHLNLKLSRVRAESLETRYKIEQQRLEVSAKSAAAQLEAQQTRISQLDALARLKRQQFGSLQVQARTNGVLQQLQVEVGQQVSPGTNLARVAEPQHLKAELKVAETQAKDVQLNQPVSIDTRNGIIPGHVMRIDPAVEQGTVTVDVSLDGALPQGARPDLSVDGTIELENLKDVLYVGRPSFGQAQSTIELFKLEDGGQNATRLQVHLGRSSVNTVEILDGLQEGDQVILSDTSAWDGQKRIRLK